MHIHKKNTKRVVVTFKLSELLYRAESILYIASKNLDADDATKARLKDISNEDNIETAKEIMYRVISQAASLASGYLVDESSAIQMSDIIFTESAEVNIVLDMPENFPWYSASGLRREMQEYAVRRLVAEWCSIVFPKLAEEWEANAYKSEYRINGILLERTSPIERSFDII